MVMGRIGKALSKKIPCYMLPDYKIYIILALAILTLYNGFSFGIKAILQVFIAVVVAALADSLIIRFTSKNWYFPSGAIISAMIIALIINPSQILITVYVVVISLVLKYLFRPKFRNIFNPAALAIVVSTFFLPVFSAWWGSGGVITFIIGLILVILIKRVSTALSFFITYLILNLGYNFLKTEVLNLSLGILAGPLVFFAFFMVIETVTTPATTRSRIIFGTAVAVLSFIFSFSDYLMGNSFFLYLSLLIMNLVMRVIPRRALE